MRCRAYRCIHRLLPHVEHALHPCSLLSRVPSVVLCSQVTGYPVGPVNFPMWGGLCRMWQPHNTEHDGLPCKQLCRHRWVNNTRGMYWFGHKIPYTWLQLQHLPACTTLAPRRP